jgi:hypothetical protein
MVPSPGFFLPGMLNGLNGSMLAVRVTWPIGIFVNFLIARGRIHRLLKSWRSVAFLRLLHILQNERLRTLIHN